MPLGTTIQSNNLALATIIARENMEDSSEDERYMIGKCLLHWFGINENGVEKEWHIGISSLIEILADLDAMDCMMDRGMDDENGAVEEDEGDDGSDTENDDADLVDCLFDDKGIKHVLSKKSKFLIETQKLLFFRRKSWTLTWFDISIRHFDILRVRTFLNVNKTF